jgi:hypothetical protein
LLRTTTAKGSGQHTTITNRFLIKSESKPLEYCNLMQLRDAYNSWDIKVD